MRNHLNYYLTKLKHLRIDRARGMPAPHKPLLLLTIFDLIEQGAIQTNQIFPSPQLVETYLKYWTCVSNALPRPYLPFYHLKTSGFWHLHAQRGQQAALATAHTFKAMTQLSSVVAFASLDDELFTLLLYPASREVLRQTIIETYLPEYRSAIEHVVRENRQVTDIEQSLLHQAEEKSPTIVDVAPASPVRSAAFRRVVMKLYNYTCAACHVRIITLDGASAVDAAHIIPFAVSHDDNIGNGLALCKLHHWAFDLGLLSLDDRYKLLVSTAFDEKGPTTFRLRNLCDKSILLPSAKPYFPSLYAMRWHREKKFQH